MATHSTVLAWRIPGTEEPAGCRLWGRTESDFRIDWLDLLAVQETLKESSPTPQFNNFNSLALSFL